MTRPTTLDGRHSCAPCAHPDLKGAVCRGEVLFTIQVVRTLTLIEATAERT